MNQGNKKIPVVDLYPVSLRAVTLTQKLVN